VLKERGAQALELSYHFLILQRRDIVCTPVLPVVHDSSQLVEVAECMVPMVGLAQCKTVTSMGASLRSSLILLFSALSHMRVPRGWGRRRRRRRMG
jgi:hypothetical protein